MIYSYSEDSRDILATCDPLLRLVAQRALSYGILDIAVVSGHRNKREQNELFRSGASKVEYPGSDHNANPSNAVDLVPYVKGVGRIVGSAGQIKTLGNHQIGLLFGLLAGVMRAAGEELRLPIGWGGDWNSDGSTLDTKFLDLAHFYLQPEESQ